MIINPKYRGLILFVSVLFLTSSCEKQSTSVIFEKKLDSVDSTWTSLSIRQKIGQVMCLNYDRAQIETVGKNNTQNFFEQYPVGAFFLANWQLINYASPENMEDEYRKSILELAASSPFPLLFSEDFETGVGNALPKYTPLTTAMGLGATNSGEMAREYGDILSREARSLGINWILNPVVDLNLNPFSFLTNVRSMGSDPERVDQQSSEQIRAMQHNGVAATAKHFPGDGTDPVNQHFTTSQVKLTVGEWENTLGKVFQNAIDTGVMCIMPGHISFPAYQKEKHHGEYLPATLSKELLTDLLKGKMGFRGVIVSDALNMAGIANYYKNDLETEIECFRAGADILLWPSLAFMDTLEARILRKEFPMARLNDAVSRVWEMKRKLGLFDTDYQPIEELTKTDIALNRKKAYRITSNAITLLSNKENLLPLYPSQDKKLLVVVISQSDHSSDIEPFINALKRKGFEVHIRHNLSVFTERENLTSISQDYNKIIFAFYSYPHMPWGDLLLHDEPALTMWSANTLPLDQVISIAFGDPYKNLIYMPRVWARINAYAADSITQQAVAELLVGDFEPSGTSPVNY